MFIILTVLELIIGVYLFIRISIMGTCITDGFLSWCREESDADDFDEWKRRFDIWNKTNTALITLLDIRIWSFEGLLKQLGEEPLNN